MANIDYIFNKSKYSQKNPANISVESIDNIDLKARKYNLSRKYNLYNKYSKYNYLE